MIQLARTPPTWILFRPGDLTYLRPCARLPVSTDGPRVCTRSDDAAELEAGHEDCIISVVGLCSVFEFGCFINKGQSACMTQENLVVPIALFRF